jgi:hypothetical protein
VRSVRRAHGDADEVQTGEVGPDEEGTSLTQTGHVRASQDRGTAPGSITPPSSFTHRAMKDATEPNSVATPMSIPFICRTGTTQTRR